jgi:hypothetical protein
MPTDDQIEAAVLRDAEGAIYVVPRSELERWRLPDSGSRNDGESDVQGHAVDAYLYFKNQQTGQHVGQPGQVFSFSFQPITIPPVSPPATPG